MEKNFNYLSDLIQKEVDNGFISGAAIKIIHKNHTCYQNEFGFSDLDEGITMRRDTIFRLASMTKPITAAATMILVDRGIIELQSPVSNYLEGFKKQKVLTKYGLMDVAKEVTIRDLLNMTSGIVYPDDTFETGRLMKGLFSEVEAAHHQGKPINTLEFCNKIGGMPLEFQPGQRWHYGASADILGAVIEVISGCKYSQYLQEEIFTPLNMVDTSFFVPDEKRERLASLYNYNDNQQKLEKFTGDIFAVFDFMAPPAFESGGAGLISTIDDYAKFVSMLLNEGTHNGRHILSKKAIEYITLPQLTKEQLISYNWEKLKGYSYANMMRIMVDPAQAAGYGTTGEYGWDGHCGNYFLVDPKEELIVVYLVQRCGGSSTEYIRKLRNIIYGAI